MIQYTSGTTGFPKGAMLTHYSTVNNAIATSEHMHLTHTDRVCGPVPYYHCFGSIIFNLGCVVSGACMVVPGDIFDPVNTLKAIDKERCTAVYGVPTMFITQLESPGFEGYNLKSLRTGVIAGAPVDKELMEAVAGKMGASEMTIAYGLTEASPVTHQTDIHDSVWHRVNTVGKPISNTKSKIVDPNTMEECPKGSVGEIWVKGYHVMKGYYKKPEETDKSLIDGWLRTGDLGFITEDNYYRISGRLKEMIIVGGHNVYPAEVEQSIHSLLEDKVEMLQVVGIPDHKLQEVVALIVKCLPGQSLSLEEVKTRCEGKLEWPKIPRLLKVLDDLTPYMTVSGKVQKFKLKELLTLNQEQV
jgi:fatty-acyl-CoA synthase